MQRIHGFTLIELMVTLAVATLIITLGIPGFYEIIKKNRIAAAANDLLASLNIARSKAITTGYPVVLCKSTDGETCTNDGHWESGWIVFVDWNLNADPSDTQPPTCNDPKGCVIHVHGALPDGYTLRTGANFANWISYLPDGRARGNGGLFNGTFTLCHGTDTTTARKIVINTGGRARISEGADSCP